MRGGTCVPRVVAAGPGQVPGEGEVQVENPPGQDDDVIEVQEGNDDLGAVAEACGEGKERTGQRATAPQTLASEGWKVGLPSNKGLIFLQQVMPPSLVY